MSLKIKKRHKLKSKEIRDILNDLNDRFNIDLTDESSLFETGEFEDVSFLLIENEPLFMYYDTTLIPTLKGIERLKFDSLHVVVDMGAVKFVTSGADVMAPGIVDADKNIKKDDLIWVCDERNRKPLAVGFALLTGEEMVENSSGKAVKVVHFVGDRLWNFVAKSL